MEIDEIFSFGKYKGLTIREVYQGTDKISKELIKGYVSHRINNNNPDETNNIITELVHFEISETLLRATPVLPDFAGNNSKSIEKALTNGSAKFDYSLRLSSNLTTLDYYNIEVFSTNLEKPEVAGGYPDYVNWCINNFKYFIIEPEDLLLLEDCDVFHFLGISIVHKIEDIYEYKPLIRKDRYEFDLKTKAINNEKYNHLSKKSFRGNFGSNKLNFDEGIDWSTYNEDRDMDQQDPEFWNQF